MSYKLNACEKYKEQNRRYLELYNNGGWTIDRFGHAKKIKDGKEYRIKFCPRVIRREIKVNHETGSIKSEWVHLASYNYNGDRV
jgi:hypothetical protein